MEATPRYSSLPATAYYDQAFFDQEIEQLFGKAWLLVAVTMEIPNSGDYVAKDILGVPIIIWNVDGKYHAYINVCPHRHSLLVNPNTSGSNEILRCPYHGWEFNGHGNVCKIPEAQCFKGLKKEGSLALKPVQIEQLENLLFIRLKTDETETLENFMGSDVYSNLQKISRRASGLIALHNVDLPCNWKLMFENGIEDYHTPLIHKTTIGQGLDLKNSHYFYGPTQNENGCLMSTPREGSAEGFSIHAPFLTISLFSGLHTSVNNQGVNITTFEQELPVTATTSERKLWVMCNKRLAPDIQKTAGENVYKVMLEDQALMANNQRAKQNAYSPQLLGIYESRISFFHEYLEKKLNLK